MTRDDIIRMAREAGATKVDAADPQCWVGAIAFEMEELSRFAALVAAAERKQCEKVCEEAIDEDSSFQWNLAVKYCLKTIQART